MKFKLALVIGALALAAVLALAGGGWYFSQQLLGVSHTQDAFSLRVLAVSPGRITLERTRDTIRPGIFGLDWATGHAVIAGVLADTGGVTRSLRGKTSGLAAGGHVHLDAYVYATPSAAGHLRYSTVMVPDPLGGMPAWYLPNRRSTWVLIVHGYKSNRSEGVRPMPVLHRMGFPILDLSYRNDVGAPPSPDHLYHLGATEWRDVEAGVRYALNHGARGVVLYGYSMGGGTVEDFLHDSAYRTRVRAVVLDAPALDWDAVLQLAADQRHLPGILAAVTERIVAWRLGIASLDSINAVKNAGSLRTPTLLFHGMDDTRVPFGPSAAFAHERPDLVTFDPVRGADHTQAWNVNPAAYDAVLSRFLRRVAP